MKNVILKIKNFRGKIIDRAEELPFFTAGLAVYIVLVEAFKVLCYTPLSPIGAISGFVGYLSALVTGIILGFAVLVLLLFFAGFAAIMYGLIMADRLGLQ